MRLVGRNFLYMIVFKKFTDDSLIIIKNYINQQEQILCFSILRILTVLLLCNTLRKGEQAKLSLPVNCELTLRHFKAWF